MPALDTLIAQLGVPIADQTLLQQALVHGSFLNEHFERTQHIAQSNERLEFLGDSVVNFVATILVYSRFPEFDEGQLTIVRSALIKTTTLAAFARRFDLGQYLLLGKGEQRSGARLRDTMLADAFEAVIAVLYLEGGIEAAQQFLIPLFQAELEHVIANGIPQDYKSTLQNRIQVERNQTPRYRTIALTGPEHQREMTIEVFVGDDVLGVGTGTSKQAATQAAARAALERLES